MKRKGRWVGGSGGIWGATKTSEGVVSDGFEWRVNEKLGWKIWEVCILDCFKIQTWTTDANMVTLPFASDGAFHLWWVQFDCNVFIFTITTNITKTSPRKWQVILESNCLFVLWAVMGDTGLISTGASQKLGASQILWPVHWNKTIQDTLQKHKGVGDSLFPPPKDQKCSQIGNKPPLEKLPTGLSSESFAWGSKINFFRKLWDWA